MCHVNKFCDFHCVAAFCMVVAQKEPGKFKLVFPYIVLVKTTACTIIHFKNIGAPSETQTMYIIDEDRPFFLYIYLYP